MVHSCKAQLSHLLQHDVYALVPHLLHAPVEGPHARLEGGTGACAAAVLASTSHRVAEAALLEGSWVAAAVPQLTADIQVTHGLLIRALSDLRGRVFEGVNSWQRSRRRGTLAYSWRIAPRTR